MRPFRDLEDFTARVAVQPRELTNLIQCGALDGLGASRTALLTNASDASNHGDQLTLGFFAADAAQAVRAESPGERLAWELHLLGLPVSVHPLETVTLPGDAVPLTLAAVSTGRTIKIEAVRLPGWTGGPGVFLGDTTGFVMVTLPENSPKPTGLAAAAGGRPLGLR